MSRFLIALLNMLGEAFDSWNDFWAIVLTSDVGEWLRTLVAALIGGVLGGFFTLRGQARAEAAQTVRDAAARDAAVADAKRAETLKDARDLYEQFVRLQGAIQTAPKPLAVYFGHAWSAEWRGIWSPSLRDKLRVGIFVLPSADLRDQLLQIVWFLSRAADYTTEGAPFPGRPNYILPDLVEALAGEGVERIAAYLRGDETFESRRHAYWTALIPARKAYEEWEQHEVDAAIAGDEARAVDQAEDYSSGEPAARPQT